MALNYPGRTFAGSKNPSEWFGNVNPAKDSRWKPRMASEGDGMPSAGYMPADMWASAKRQAPGDLADVDDRPQPEVATSRADPGGVRRGLDQMRRGADPGSVWMGGLHDAMSGNNLSANIAVGNQVIRARRNKAREEAIAGPFGRAAGESGGRTLGGYDDTMRQLARSEADDGTSWGNFFAALIGKEHINAQQGLKTNIDIGGIGRLKAQDVPTGKVYDTQGGEVAPGMRGAAPEWAQAQQGLQGGSKGWYTPDEWSGMGQLSRSRVRGSMFNR